MNIKLVSNGSDTMKKTVLEPDGERTSPSIDDTIEFIKQAHAGQSDKGGKPYWRHPVSVMNRLSADAPLTYKLQLYSTT